MINFTLFVIVICIHGLIRVFHISDPAQLRLVDPLIDNKMSYGCAGCCWGKYRLFGNKLAICVKLACAQAAFLNERIICCSRGVVVCFRFTLRLYNCKWFIVDVIACTWAFRCLWCCARTCWSASVDTEAFIYRLGDVCLLCNRTQCDIRSMRLLVFC